MNENKMYVIVRNDLSTTYRCVQGAHALSQYALEYSHQFESWDNQYLIFISVFNLRALRKIQRLLKSVGIPYSVFKEPDLGNQITAIAFRSIHMTEKIKTIIDTLPLAN